MGVAVVDETKIMFLSCTIRPCDASGRLRTRPCKIDDWPGLVEGEYSWSTRTTNNLAFRVLVSLDLGCDCAPYKLLIRVVPYD